LLKVAGPSQTPDPSTPDLCWDDTPASPSILTALGNDSDSDGGAVVPLSPLVAREHRARLKRLAAIRFDLSPSPCKFDNTVDPNISPCIDPTPLTEDLIIVEDQVPIGLNQVEVEHKLDEDYSSLSAIQCHVLPEGDTSSQRRTPSQGEDALKLEARGYILQSEGGGRDDSREVIPIPYFCDTRVAPDALGNSDDVEPQSESAVSALGGCFASLTLQTHSSTDNSEALDASVVTDDLGKPTLSWTPSATLLWRLPIDVMRRLHDNPTRCVANNAKGPRSGRCRNKNAVKLTQEDVDTLSEEIRSLPSLPEIVDIVRIVQNLGSRALCHNQHRNQVVQELAELNSYVDLRDPEHGHCATLGSQTVIRNALQVWFQSFLKPPVSTLYMANGGSENISIATGIFPRAEHDQPPLEATHTDLGGPNGEQEGPSHLRNSVQSAIFSQEVTWDRLQRKSQFRTSINSREFSATTQSTHLLADFQPYCTENGKRMSASELIRHVLWEPLCETDRKGKMGNIYSYWHPGNFGYVKIGHAANTESRLKAWQSKCKIEVEQITNLGDDKQFQVLYPNRIEALIHAELKDCRLREPACPGCGKSHKEWFRVDPNLATKVIQKWVKLSLYEGGRLKESLTNADIEKMCEVTTLKETTNLKSLANRRSRRPSAIGTGRSRRSGSRVELEVGTPLHWAGGCDISNWKFPPPSSTPPADIKPLCDDVVSIKAPTATPLVNPVVS